MRDATLEETIYFNFTTRAFASGVPTTLSGTPALSVLESNNASPITSGVSLSVDRASVTGLNQATVVATAANGYEAGKSYCVYISTGTVGGVSVIGEVVAEFTVQASAAFTRLGAPAGASVSADIAAAKVDTAAIKVKTDFLPSATAGASGGVFIAGTNAATTITTALTTTFTGNLTGSVASVTGAVGSVTGNVGGNVTGSVGSVATGGITAGSIAADAIGASELAADAVSEISAAVWAEATRTLTAGTNIVLAKGTGVTGFNDLSAAQVNAEVDTALADVRLDELLAADSDIDGAAPPTVGSVFHELMSKTTGSFTFDQTTDSLEAVRDRGDSAWITATGFATAANLATMQGNVTDILADTADMQPKLGTPVTSISADIAAIEAQTDDIGTAGAGLTAVPWNAAWDAEVQSEVADALAAYGVSTATDVTNAAANVSVDEIQVSALADLFNTNSGTTYASAVSGSVVKEIADNAGGSGLTAGAIADAVWDEALSGHLGAGSTGEALNAAGAAGDPWITALPGSYTAGQAGYIVGTNLNATVSSRATQTSVDTIDGIVDSILADTNELQTDWANGGRLDLILDARASQTSVDDLPTNAELATALAAADDAVLAVLGTPAGASISADIAAIEAQTDDIGVAGAGLTALASAANLATLTAYVDTEVAAIKAKTDNLPAAPAATGDIPSAATNAAAMLAATVEGAVTVVQSMRLVNAAVAGKASGLATTNAMYRDLGDTKDRIDATVDADGNRSAVTLDLT